MSSLFTNILLEREESEYQKFFKGKLAQYKVKSPAELGDKISDFFDEVSKDWKGEKKEVEKSKKEAGL